MGFDISKITVGSYQLYFFGTPGQTRFEFARHIVARGAHIGILIIDSVAANRRGVSKREQQIEQEMIDNGLPYVICANKRDLDYVMSIKEMQSYFQSPVLPISAKTGSGIDCLQNTLLEMLDANKHQRNTSLKMESVNGELAYG